MPVDAGTTVSEVLELSARFGASAIVAASSSSADVTGRRVPLAENLDLILLDGATPVEYADTAVLKLTSGSTGLPKAARTTEAQLDR